MSGKEPIAAIAILGAGIVGHAAAIAFRRALPRASVTLIETPPDARAMADRIGAAAASLHDFHRQIGLDPLLFRREAAAMPCLGTRFSATGQGDREWQLFEGEEAHFIDGIALHHLWLRHERAAPEGTPPWHAHARRQAEADEQAGVRFDPARYRALLARLAHHLGVETVQTDTWVAEMEDSRIVTLRLDDGRVVAADLFADCSGPDAGLRRLAGDDFEPWDRYLPALSLVETKASAQPGAAFDQLAIAHDGMILDTGVARYRFSLSTDAPMPGRRATSWSGNVIAFGDAALTAPPFGGHVLSLAIDDILRAIQMLPRRDGCGVHAREYNRRTAIAHRYLLDWSAAHWLGEDRPVPAGLQHLVAQFGARGRIPFRDGDPLTAGDWIAMLIGKDLRPERIDPTALVPGDDQVRLLLARVRAKASRIDAAA